MTDGQAMNAVKGRFSLMLSARENGPEWDYFPAMLTHNERALSVGLTLMAAIVALFAGVALLTVYRQSLGMDWTESLANPDGVSVWVLVVLFAMLGYGLYRTVSRYQAPEDLMSSWMHIHPKGEVDVWLPKNKARMDDFVRDSVKLVDQEAQSTLVEDGASIVLALLSLVIMAWNVSVTLPPESGEVFLVGCFVLLLVCTALALIGAVRDWLTGKRSANNCAYFAQQIQQKDAQLSARWADQNGMTITLYT